MISDQLRYLLISSEVKYKDIQKNTGIDPDTLSRFANGGGGLSMKHMDKLAEFFNVNLAPGIENRVPSLGPVGRGSGRRTD